MLIGHAAEGGAARLGDELFGCRVKALKYPGQKASLQYPRIATRDTTAKTR